MILLIKPKQIIPPVLALYGTSYDNNRLYQTLDLTNWTPQNIGYATNYIYCIEYINGYWFVGGYLPDASWDEKDAMIISTDGENWTSLGTLTFEVDGFAYDGTNYVAVGSRNGGSGFLYCSGDPTVPTNWILSVSDHCKHVRDVVYNATYDMFIAIADEGYSDYNPLLYSIDHGVTWVSLGNSIFNNDAYGLTYNGTIMVAGSASSNTLAYCSGDPSNIDNWGGLGNTIFTTLVFSVAYGNGIWVAGGKGTNTLAYCSGDPTNILNWTGLGESKLTTECRDVKFNSNDGYFYAVGVGGDTYRAYKSNDGANWSVATDIIGASFYAVGIK